MPEAVTKPICGAKTRSGGQCRQSPMVNGRCKMHGGMTVPPGPGHHNYRHGNRSKLRLKSDLALRLNEAAADPNLMTVNPDVEALEVRLGELLERIDTAASVDFCSNVQKLIAAIRSTDAAAIGQLLPIVEQQASVETRNIESWREYDRFADSKRKLIESHRRSQFEAGQMILATQALQMMDQLIDAFVSGGDYLSALREAQRRYAAMMGIYETQATRVDQQEPDQQ